MALQNVASTLKYRPFDRSEVRLLEIQPPQSRSVDDRLICRLVHQRLDDETAPDFIALSALYGDAVETEPVHLNGHRVLLPANLIEALRHVRAVFLTHGLPTSSAASSPPGSIMNSERPAKRTSSKRQPEWLHSIFKNVGSVLGVSSSSHSGSSSKQPLRVWLDLLCVNRRNPLEEQEQRSTMWRAYNHAKIVVGWLGPKDPTSDLAISIIREWDKCMPAQFGEPGDKEAHPENYAPQMKWMGPVAHLSNIPEGVTDPRDVPSYRAITAFFQRPYFRNTWILEDMAMARFPTFLLGEEIVSWMQLLRLNRVNEDIKDHGAAMFPDELRGLLEYMPLGTVYTFLKDFDQRQKAGGPMGGNGGRS